MKKLFSILLFSLLFNNAFASHISGGEITYKCLGGNLYEIKLSYFWDCVGGFNPGSQQTIDANGCGNNLSLTVTQSSLTPGDGVYVGGVCTSASTVSVCKKRIDYLGTITLPAACDSWTFSLGSCCRSAAIDNIDIGGSDSYFHFATLNNTGIACNNSPNFIYDQLGNFCLYQPASFNLGASELDGHQITYDFISAYETASITNVYNAGYSAAIPIPGITINQTTGLVNFTPTTIGEFVVVIQATEKDANGTIIGTIMRDFTIIVTNCSNQIISAAQGQITYNTAGNISMNNPRTLQICQGIPFCFDLEFTDPNTSDSVLISSPNLLANLPGASIVTTYTNGISNACKATICWTAISGGSTLNKNFTIIASDKSCPVLGKQFFNYTIDISDSTFAGNDKIICGTQSASLNAIGTSSVFSWTDLSGNPIPVNSAFSCNPCQNPIVKPSVTSTYVLTNTGATNGCKNKDTVIVNVVSDFTLSTSASHSTSCLNSDINLNSTVIPTNTYSYYWSPSVGLNSTTSNQVICNHSIPGNFQYNLTVTSPNGCIKTNTLNAITVVPITTPQVSITPSYSTTNIGGLVYLDVDFGTVSSGTCGLAATNCAGTATYQIGTSTTEGSGDIYTPYEGFWESAKHQYLVLASELQNAGISSGKLSSLAFKVTNLNGNANTFENFSIKLKCTSSTSLSTTMDNSGLSQVYGPVTVTAVIGQNTYNFNQAYEWDGVSNLLVDVCFFNQAWDGNISVEYTNVGYNASRYIDNDNVDQCPLSTVDGIAQERPNMIFGNCAGANPNAYSYQWSPTIGLDNPNIKNPVATVTGQQVYTVVVTPTAAVNCNASSTATVDVLPTALKSNSSIENSISIYPNPNNGLLTINFGSLTSENFDVHISNSIGQVVFTTRVANQKTSLDVQTLKNGIYFITISDAISNQKTVKKIVIQK